MIKINNSEGKLFGVFHNEGQARKAIKESHHLLDAKTIKFIRKTEYFSSILDYFGYHITEDTVNCQVCGNELDDDFDNELLIGYRCSYCRENPEMGKYPV